MCRASHYSRGQACLALYGRAKFRCARDGIFQLRITVHKVHDGSRNVIVDFGCRADINRIAHDKFHSSVRELDDQRKGRMTANCDRPIACV